MAVSGHVGNVLGYYQLHHFQSYPQTSVRKDPFSPSLKKSCRWEEGLAGEKVGGDAVGRVLK